MKPGAVVAITVAALFVAGILYGLSHDLRNWIENRRWQRDEREWRRRLDEMERAGFVQAPCDVSYAGLVGLASMADTRMRLAALSVYDPEDWA